MMKNPIDLAATVARFIKAVKADDELLFKTSVVDLGTSLAFDVRRVADSLEKLTECVKSDFSGHKFFDTSGIDKG